MTDPARGQGGDEHVQLDANKTATKRLGAGGAVPRSELERTDPRSSRHLNFITLLASPVGAPHPCGWPPTVDVR